MRTHSLTYALPTDRLASSWRRRSSGERRGTRSGRWRAAFGSTFPALLEILGTRPAKTLPREAVWVYTASWNRRVKAGSPAYSCLACAGVCRQTPRA